MGKLRQGAIAAPASTIRELIREDEKHKAEERLEALLLEGLQGKETAVTRDDLNAIRKEALATLKARKHRR